MAREIKGKSKTDVTARDKTGKATNRDCSHCGSRILTDREMMVVMDPHRANKTYYRRECFNQLLGTAAELATDGAARCPREGK